jgi:DNA-binding SARP family transcriptional activator
MWFGVLGPLLVRDRDSVIGVSAPLQRVLLAALLVRAGDVVPADVLAELVWDGAPPGEADTTLRSHVSRLRRALGQCAGARLVTRYRGYAIDAGEEEVDLSRFRLLTRDGGAVVRAGEWGHAWDLLAEGLELWRGEPLADIPSELLRREYLPELEQLRLQAVEWQMDAGLQLGRDSELVAELQSLAATYPLRERFQGQLMLALVRCGRQAEALAAYQRARQVLVQQLGAEPGAELQELHQRILTGDPGLGVPQHAAPAATGRAAVPRELPAPVSRFVGRAGELATLTGLLDQAEQTPTAIVISAIGGTAGVGKTALAVRWAHQVADRFPDGQLYVNLRGYDPDQPMASADALAGFLRALGVPGQDIPAGEEERAARYRSLVAGQRMLVVLDNASEAGQVRPLLPGTSACAVLVTSRHSLPGLVARDGAARLDLGLLRLEDAVSLLRELIGERATVDPEATAALAGHCCCLPLALRVAAELANARSDIPLADLVAELADQQQRLAMLEADGDPRTAVRAVFSWSYRSLDPGAARAFRLAGLHPGPDFDAHALAALAETSPGDADRMLSTLARGHLIQCSAPGRYGMHDLLRAYAREQAAASDGDGSCQHAVTRLFDYYLATAAAAMDILYPAEAHVRPSVPPSGTVVPAMPGEAAARAWLDRERANLVAVVVHCAGHGWAAHAKGLAGTVYRYLIIGSHLSEAHTIYSQALTAAQHSGDPAGEAEALNGLGSIGVMKGHFRDAADHYQAALERYRQCDSRAGQARVLHNLGVTEHYLQNHQAAVGYFHRAIAAFEAAEDHLGAARVMGDLATAETELGSYDQAEEHLQRAVPVLRAAKHRSGEADALARIGDLNSARGQLAQAASCYEQSVSIHKHIDNPTGVANGLCSLGQVSLRQAEYQQAITYLRQGIALFRQAGDQHGETVALRSLAEALQGAGQAAAARAELAAALRLAADTANTYQQASAHRDLADCHHSAGQHEQARHHWEQALSLFTDLDAPEADVVRARLGESPDGG